MFVSRSGNLKKIREKSHELFLLSLLIKMPLATLIEYCLLFIYLHFNKLD